MKVNAFLKVLLLLFVCFVCAVESSRSDSAPANLDGTWEWESKSTSSPKPGVANVISTTFTFSGNSFSRVRVMRLQRDQRMLEIAPDLYNQTEKDLKAKGYEIVEIRGPFITFRESSKGTFSLTDTEIELVYENGNIVVQKFSRTENTFTMNETRYLRKQSQLQSGVGASAEPSSKTEIFLVPINSSGGSSAAHPSEPEIQSDQDLGSSNNGGGSYSAQALSDVMKQAAEQASEKFRASHDDDMVFVQGGTFTRGCTPEQGRDCDNYERPAQQVTLSDFYIGKHEVTQGQWQMVMRKNPSGREGDNLPVVNVSWNDVQEFIKMLNGRTGGNYRLPTEAEWEYVARGGSKSQGYKYSGSDDIEEVAWVKNNSGKEIHQVGTKKANELGVYDMSGNVWEWVQDGFGYYSSKPETNPKGGGTSDKIRIYRGGSWDNGAKDARVSKRNERLPESTFPNIGFRLVRSSK